MRSNALLDHVASVAAAGISEEGGDVLVAVLPVLNGKTEVGWPMQTLRMHLPQEAPGRVCNRV